MRLKKQGGIWLAMVMFLLTVTVAWAEEGKGSPAPPAAGTESQVGKVGMTAAVGEAVRPTVEVTVSVLSNYISKGDELSRNSIVIQPQFNLGYRGFYFTIWGNLDTRPYLAETSTYRGDRRHNWTETDIYAGYNHTFGIVNTGIQYSYFGNAAFWNSNGTSGAPDQKDDQELSVSLGLNTLLSPNIKAARSFDSTQVWYFLLSLSHTFELNEKVGLSLSASASYLLSQDDNRLKINSDGSDKKANGTRIDRYNNFHDAVVTVGLPVKPWRQFTITPQLSYVFPMCDEAKYDMRNRSMQIDTAFADRQSSYLVGGVSAMVSF